MGHLDRLSEAEQLHLKALLARCLELATTRRHMQHIATILTRLEGARRVRQQ